MVIPSIILDDNNLWFKKPLAGMILQVRELGDLCNPFSIEDMIGGIDKNPISSKHQKNAPDV